MTSQRCPCTHHPVFFPRISWQKRVQTVWSQWLYQPWPQLWIDPSSLTSPSVRSEHCATIWTGPQISSRIRSWSLCTLRNSGFDKDISLATISSWIKQTVILCYELSDQETHFLHQVKTHDVRAFAASKAFQSGICLEEILSACHWKSHNTFTQFYLKLVARADSELYHLSPVLAAQQINKWPLD